MGIKGEVGDGFPQSKPAFTLLVDWEPEDIHTLGPTTHPKNKLSYAKFRGTIKTAQGSDLPPFEADIVDSGAWAQEDNLPSGEAWVKTELFALLRVTEPSGSSVDPEMETGLIRMKWNCLGIVPRLQALLKKDHETAMEGPRGLLGSLSFTTGDPRYKFLEHAVYVGICRFVITPPENAGERPQFHGEYKISYVAA